MLLRSAAAVILLAAALPAADAAAPRITVKWTDGAARAISLPARVSGHVLFAPLRVHGAQLMFLIDTGAADSLLDERAAVRLGLLTGGAGGGGASARPVPNQDVATTAFTVVEVPFAVTSLAPLSGRFGLTIDGILGYDFLEWFAVDLDFAARRLRLAEARADSAKNRTCVPLGLINRLPYTSITVVSQKGVERTGTFLVATGESGTLRLAGAFGADPALGGTAAIRAAAVRLGPFELKEIELAAREPARADHADGVLGGGLLDHFTVRLSYGSQRMCLTPAKKSTAPRLDSSIPPTQHSS
ncbi:MAG TPA: retropepsin-like aspartic protease [Candidatus Dormibacteraeota bacterium]|nr:retropepsin-like aspartic protease [Candidatus Dormibacteraeota bacterium]